jgi:hypothetical protein
LHRGVEEHTILGHVMHYSLSASDQKRQKLRLDLENHKTYTRLWSFLTDHHFEAILVVIPVLQLAIAACVVPAGEDHDVLVQEWII